MMFTVLEVGYQAEARARKVVVESDKVSPQPPLLQAKQSQIPQLFLIRLLLQTLPQLRCPSLDTLQHLNVPLVVEGPKQNTVFEVQPHQCQVQGHDHIPSPAGHAIFHTSQDAIGFLGCLGTLLAHIQAAVNQHPQVLFCLAAFQPLFPKPVALHGVAVAQVQDLALGLVKPHTIHLSPSIQPVQVPLQSLPTLKQINTPAQLGVICKLTEGALDPFIQIIDKDIKQNWPQHRALGNTACDWPPTGVNSIHHHSLGPAIQPVLHPVKSTPVQAMSSQFLQENAISCDQHCLSRKFAHSKEGNFDTNVFSTTYWTVAHDGQPWKLCHPPLDAFKDLSILLKLWGPELHTVLKGNKEKEKRKKICTYMSLGKCALCSGETKPNTILPFRGILYPRVVLAPNLMLARCKIGTPEMPKADALAYSGEEEQVLTYNALLATLTVLLPVALRLPAHSPAPKTPSLSSMSSVIIDENSTQQNIQASVFTKFTKVLSNLPMEETTLEQ
ncbi:hypothetical protein QYF61_016619, partial [Mycteria americana]